MNTKHMEEDGLIITNNFVKNILIELKSYKIACKAGGKFCTGQLFDTSILPEIEAT